MHHSTVDRDIHGSASASASTTTQPSLSWPSACDPRRWSRSTGTKVRWLLARAVSLAAVCTAGFGPAAAFADPPRPTDYRTEVVSVEPATDGLEVSIVGGDSFIEIDAGGHEVVVPGYQFEPYLQFAADGTVSENVRSPAHFLNTSRYSATTPPPEADASAPPEWVVVATDGRYAWHDHRTHWMLAEPPLGLGPGDQILDSVITITVDGGPVEIAVVSVWMPPPARLPWIASGIVAAVVAALVAAFGGRRPRLVLVAALATAAASLVVGVWQTRSLPSETGPPFTDWVLPLSAGLIAVVGLARTWTPFTVRAITLVAGVQLVVWTVLRLDVLDHAVLPTSAPFWFDRSITAATGVVAIVLVYASVVSVVRLMYPAAAVTTASVGVPAASPTPPEA
jgi:hypothetical protein